MKTALLTLLLLVFSLTAEAELRPISSISLPQEMMPLQPSADWPDSVLRVGILGNNSTPWNMVVGRDLYGINADYLVALSRSSGLRFRIDAFESRQALEQALLHGQLDMLFGVPQHALARGLSATQPWFTSPLRIYRSRDNLRPVMFNSADAHITLSRSALALINPIFAQQHHFEIVENDLQAMYALLNNQSDYVIADETSAGFLLSQLQQGQIYQLDSPLQPGALQLQAVTATPTLTRQLDMAIRQLPMEVVNDIQARWSNQLPRYQDTFAAHLSPMERRWIAAHPVVTYAAVEDDYPWSYRTANGQPAGYSVELLDIIGQNTGLHFQPRWVNNAQQARELLEQQLVMIQLALPLSGDDTMQANTLPIWRVLWGVYTGKMSPPVTGWQMLAGQKIGVRRGDIARLMLPRDMNSVIFDDNKQLYNALATGQIDALVDNVISARRMIQSRYNNDIRLAFAASDTAWPVTLGVAPDLPLLRTLLNTSLQQIPQDTQKRMRENWSARNTLLAGAGENAMRPVSLFVLITALLAIVILLWLLGRRYLEQRRERSQRQQLERDREEAERASQMKSQFLATISHELRTPMQAILGLLELEVSRQPAARDLAVIHGSAASLLTLLNDLQDHAKLENNSFTLLPKPLDPARWLSRLADVYPPLMRQNGPIFRVQTVTPLPPQIMIDEARLQQIANNLISNAIKYTREGEIRVTLAAEEPARRLRLQVIDSGSGIPDQEQARLFERWYQPPSGRQFSVQGSGLGLSICKEIVSRMGGEILLESVAGRGTTVTVLLPWQNVEASCADLQQLTSAVNAPTDTQLKIAIVDDHPTNLLVIQQQLAWFGLQADCYPDGRMLLAANQPYDLLFIDYSMPHPDGTTLAKIIRRRERHGAPRARLVICSADADILSHPRVMALADHLLLKPVSLREIEALLPEGARPAFGDLHSRLEGLSGHNSVFFQKIINTLQNTLREDTKRLQVALADRAWEQAEKALHRMRGSWQMLGYAQGELLCQQVTEQIRAQYSSSSALNLLIELTESLLKELDTHAAYSF